MDSQFACPDGPKCDAPISNSPVYHRGGRTATTPAVPAPKKKTDAGAAPASSSGWAAVEALRYGAAAVTLSFLGIRQLFSLHAWTATVSSKGLSSPLARVTVIGIVALSS